jgi:hypothetical protein
MRAGDTTKGKAVGARGTPLADGEVIPEGRRNSDLASMAGSMRRRGLVAEEILPSLLAVNGRRCEPPLDDAEVEKIARSIAKYPAGEVPAGKVRGRAAPAVVEFRLGGTRREQ